MKLTDGILQLLFPEKCVLCRAVLNRKELDLCHSCRDTASRDLGQHQDAIGADRCHGGALAHIVDPHLALHKSGGRKASRNGAKHLR